MQIQLKQSEIINALKLYISNQGINLNGKTVEVAFTAGRKSSGLTADVCINDSLEALSVPTGPIPRDVTIPITAPVYKATPEPEAVEESPEEVVGEAEEAGAFTIKSSSLFSN